MVIDAALSSHEELRIPLTSLIDPKPKDNAEEIPHPRPLVIRAEPSDRFSSLARSQTP
jgi:hypothetical protein